MFTYFNLKYTYIIYIFFILRGWLDQFASVNHEGHGHSNMQNERI